MSCNKNVDEEGIHLHCLSCYSSSCHLFPQCSIIYCDNHCGIQFHECKRLEHSLVCREKTRPCINSIHGCSFKINSVNLMTHLEHCPASIIYCGVNWNRSPLHSRVREQWLPFNCGNPVGIVGDLDTEFAISDQERLKKEYQNRMKRGARRIRHRLLTKRISRGRLEELERLLFGGEKTMKCSGDKSEDSNNVEEDFHTCDNLFPKTSHEAENKNHISNTNMRDSYFEVPNTFIYGGNYKQQIITKSHINKNKWKTEEGGLSKEDILNRRKALSGLNLSTYPLGFNVTLECLPGYFTQYPLYRVTCCSLLRRDQYSWHCKNSHCDIGFHLNGWLLHRCPLAHYGCPFHQMRLKPKGRTIRFAREFSCFSTCYDEDENYFGGNRRNSEIALLDLPIEVLIHLMCFLDNLSLNCMAKTCRWFRKVCHSMVDELGMVVTTWTKREYEESRTSTWKEGQTIRSFSTASSPIREWTYSEIPSMGEHLKACAFYERIARTSKVKLLDLEEFR